MKSEELCLNLSKASMAATALLCWILRVSTRAHVDPHCLIPQATHYRDSIHSSTRPLLQHIHMHKDPFFPLWSHKELQLSPQ